MVAVLETKEKETMNCVINGESLSGDWLSTDSLLTVLRHELDLCSVKEGCEQGDCGSCTVLLNDEPVLACQTQMGDVAEQTVTTWEGLTVETRHEHAKGLAKAGLACGFCVPGMLLRWHAESSKGQRLSREQIVSLLSKHYCRCTGYASWLHALQHMSLSGTRRHMPTISLWDGAELQHIPRLLENVGTLHLLGRLLAGEPYFVGDLKVPQMLEAALSFVPQAFGEVVSIRLKDILPMEGVEAVLTAKGILCKAALPGTQTIPETLEFDLEETGEQFLLHTLDSIQSPVTRSESLERSTSGDESFHLFDDESLLQMQGGVSPTLESFVGLVSFQDWAELEQDSSDLGGASEVAEVAEVAGGAGVSGSFGVSNGFLSEDSSGGHSGERLPVHIPGSPLLADIGDSIHSCGDVVAVVVASTREQARLASQAMEVVVEEKEEPTLDAEYASQRGWEDEAISLAWESGDVTEVFREAHMVVSGTWNTSSVDAGCLEPPSCLVTPMRDHRLKVYAGGPSAAKIQAVVAKAVNKELDDVDVSLLPAGGSFDTRLSPPIEAYAAKIAVALGRPVKLTLSRDDMSRLLPKRHACRIHMSLACDEQGRICALRMDFLADTGGLAQDAALVLRQALAHAFGPYRIPAYSLKGKMLCSNLPNAGAVSGDGVAQVCFALESLMDMMSHRMGIDGWVLRYSNILEPGDILPNGHTLGRGCRAKQTLEAVRDLFYKHEETVGIACSWLGCDEFLQAESEVRVSLRMDAEERCHIMLPRGDCGQNLYVRVLQMVEQECGFAPEQIVLNVGVSRTEKALASPNAPVAFSSWGVLEAVRRAMRKLTEAQRANVSLAHQEFVGLWKRHESIKTPMVRDDGQDASSLSMSSLGAEASQMPLYRGYSFATQLVVLHQEHGTLRRIITACDLGHPKQPEIFSQQIEGAVHRGLGYALQEEFVTEEGMPKSCTLRDMGSVLPAHTPHLQTILVTDPSENQRSLSSEERDWADDQKHVINSQENRYPPSSEKGDGGVAMFGVAPATASASYRYYGKRHYSLPMKRSELAASLQSLEKEGDLST